MTKKERKREEKGEKGKEETEKESIGGPLQWWKCSRSTR